ncbi:MAG: site-2 protease family protein [Spirochaetota bacterium]
MESIYIKLFLYVIIVLSASFHEFAHAFTAFRLGDSTAKNEGRMTLNPLKHIDLAGTVVVPLVLLFFSGIFIGWAKPVPYNPYNLRDKKYGSLKVGIAGPVANFLIALILGIFLRLALSEIFGMSLIINSQWSMFLSALALIIYINIFLGLFNLIPIPPLDGSKALMDLFPKTANAMVALGILGIFLALAIAFLILSPLAGFIFKLIVGHSFAF